MNNNGKKIYICHSMCLGSQFPTHVGWIGTSTLASMLWVKVPTQHTRCMPTHSHQKEHDVTWVSCGDIKHHILMFWWCGLFWMTRVTSVLKGYKRNNAWGRGSRFWFNRVKVYTSKHLGMSQHWVCQQFIHKEKIMCLVCCFIVVVWF